MTIVNSSGATFTDANWSTVGGGVTGSQVNALTMYGGDLYAGGSFTAAGGLGVSKIARWNGTNWSGVGAGFSGSLGAWVQAFAVLGSDLCAAGQFNSAGGQPANYVAKWNGTYWTNMGTGLPSQVSSLAVNVDTLYASGGFGVAPDGNSFICVAKWDGTNWSFLPGMWGPGTVDVATLAVQNGNLYAAGAFTSAGGTPANSIARWDGTNWSPLGGGVTFGVYSPQLNTVVVSGADLYVGGYFWAAGGIPATNIAKWNGSTWTNLGAGLNDQAISLAVSGNNLYAAGPFTMAGGVAANGIAKWDGTNWSALGSGLSGGYPIVNTLVVAGSDLYAGGSFTTAGGRPAGHIARAYLPALPALTLLAAGNGVSVSWPAPDTAGFTLEALDPTTTAESWTSCQGVLTNDGTNTSMLMPATKSAQVFRLRK